MNPKNIEEIKERLKKLPPCEAHYYIRVKDRRWIKNTITELCERLAAINKISGEEEPPNA